MDCREDDPEPHVIFPKHLEVKTEVTIIYFFPQRTHWSCSVSCACIRCQKPSCVYILDFPVLWALRDLTTLREGEIMATWPHEKERNGKGQQRVRQLNSSRRGSRSTVGGWCSPNNRRWLTLVHTHLGSGFSSFRSVSVPLGPMCVYSSFTWVRSQLYINTIQGQLYRDLLQYQKF